VSAPALPGRAVELACSLCGGVFVALVPPQQRRLRREGLCPACVSATAVFSADA
jgi:hypothetical protein